MSKNPKVTVLLPSYNGEKFISEALKSISDQTFSDLEILVINDGSIDGTLDILNKAKEPRLRIINNEKNLGLVASLNIGIDNALGEYIARMDQDDIALPERLEKQVKFMDSHNDVAACGTWVKTFGKIDGFINKTLTDPEDIKANLLFYTSMAHPTVMIREKRKQLHSKIFIIKGKEICFPGTIRDLRLVNTYDYVHGQPTLYL
jgi:glycosyltransferase involved in cell wall biosynthesis